jgi:MerR family transcriptional regulator, light-induced transcriptional regulator
MVVQASDHFLHIGPFSRRVGVSPDLLRAWERRYGVPTPTRTAEGVRLYTGADEELVLAMRRAIARGLTAAEAARHAVAAAPEPGEREGSRELPAIRTRLEQALTRLDEATAQEELDRLFGAYSLDVALADVILPYLHDLGDRWACGEIGVGHEHFASTLIHGRLLSLTRKWDQGHGPRALLACPSAELHTLGLLCFGLALRTHGWRITYLGADTPIEALAELADAIRPDRIVLASHRSGAYRPIEDQLARLAARTPVALGGAGVRQPLAERLGALALEGDPISAASRVAAAHRPG